MFTREEPYNGAVVGMERRAMTPPISLHDVDGADARLQQEAPFTAWPEPGVGFRVLDLRTMAWAAGPFPTPQEAVEAMDHLNWQAAAATRTKAKR
jgi:hypothetical protein